MPALAERVALPASHARNAKRRRSRRHARSVVRDRILGGSGVAAIELLGRLPLVVTLRLGELTGWLA